MKKQVLSVRDVDEAAWRRFRAKISEEGLKTGEALSEALRIWLREKELQKNNRDPRKLLTIKSVRIGKSEVRWSEEIDKVLYGSDS